MKIGDKEIKKNGNTYFIAEIGINHDGDYRRALKLIKLAKKAGADCVKFQNFHPSTLVSDISYSKLLRTDKLMSNQIKKYSIPTDWTPKLKAFSDDHEIEYLTTPFDINELDELNKYLNAFKIGSGDITWTGFLKKVSRFNKPIILSTGASNLDDVIRAVKTVMRINKKIILMQCNSNYSALEENYSCLNLNVIRTYLKLFPGIVVGLSDHTPGYGPVLAAVSLGARVIEKHFTDDSSRHGPDHKVSLTPEKYAEMVNETRWIERALGNGKKKIEKNEQDMQRKIRRSIHAKRRIKKGEIIKEEDLIMLRPELKSAFKPYEIGKVVNRFAKKDIKRYQAVEYSGL